MPGILRLDDQLVHRHGARPLAALEFALPLALHAGEPYHDNYSKDELRGVLNGRFAAVDLGTSNSSMSLYFVATKDPAAVIAHPRELTAALR